MREIIFTKYSNDRSPKYAIRTTIETENDKKYICKKAMSPEAEAHIYNLLSSREKLDKIYSQSRFFFAEGSLDKNKACFPFVQGRTLSEKIVEMLNHGEKRKAFDIIKVFSEELQNKCEKHRFEQSDRFREVFGEAVFDSEQWAADVCDIDLIFENIIGDTEWTVIDYEWTFDFDIPIKFVLYRALYYLFKENDWGITPAELYEPFGISDTEAETFSRMEQQFQNHVSGKNVPLYRMREKIANPLISVGNAIGEYKENSLRKRIHVYINRGTGYSEADSYYIENPYNKDGSVLLEIEIDTDITEVRIDPMQGSGIFYIESVESQDGEALNYYSNGKSIGSRLVNFDGYDAQVYVIIAENMKCSKIRIKGSLELGNMIVEQELKQEVLCYGQQIQLHKEKEERLEKERAELIRNNARLENEKTVLAQEIAAMKATKAWKFYEKYRGLMKK